MDGLKEIVVITRWRKSVLSISFSARNRENAGIVTSCRNRVANWQAIFWDLLWANGGES